MRFSCRSDIRLRVPMPGLLALGVAALALVPLAGCANGGSGSPVRVVIPQGATFRSAADSLESAGLVEWPRVFRVYARFTGRDDRLQAGTYRIQKGTSWAEILDRLTTGRGIVHRVTIPEGFALLRIVPLLAQTLEVPPDSVQAAVRDTALLRELDVPTPHLEGYLFPDTYFFADGTSAHHAVTTMVRRFQEVWRPEWDARLAELALSRHDIVTLASIVEREARVAEERPVIAAVYHNRLRDGMPLQADPTVQYAHGRASYERVYYKDLEIDSPYNTYRHRGLPPGPIASPGLASIEAALYPANVPYRFFVAHPDGRHEFHVDFAGHTRARERLRRARQDARGGGAPVR